MIILNYCRFWWHYAAFFCWAVVSKPLGPFVSLAFLGSIVFIDKKANIDLKGKITKKIFGIFNRYWCYMYKALSQYLCL